MVGRWADGLNGIPLRTSSNGRGALGRRGIPLRIVSVDWKSSVEETACEIAKFVAPMTTRVATTDRIRFAVGDIANSLTVELCRGWNYS